MGEEMENDARTDEVCGTDKRVQSGLLAAYELDNLAARNRQAVCQR